MCKKGKREKVQRYPFSLHIYMYIVLFTMIENTVMGMRKGDYEVGLVYIEKITSG